MFRKIYNRLLKYFWLEMFWTALPFEALSWYTSNLGTSMLLTFKNVFGRPVCALLFVCELFFPAVRVLPNIFHKLMSKFNLCLKFCLELMDQRCKLLWVPCLTDLGMLGQIIHYSKMRANLLWETWNTTMPIFRDQIRVRIKLIFTHIIQDGVNCDWRL